MPVSSRKTRSGRHDSPVAVLIIGLGNIGLGYDLKSEVKSVFTHARACMTHPEYRLAGGVDPQLERRKEFESFTACPSYSSLNDLDIRPGFLDLVIIATPTGLRLEIVKQSLALRPRAILLEKPLASSLEEALEILSLCRANNVTLYVNYFRFFDPVLRQLPDYVKQNGYGALRHIECRYSKGIINNASHFMSLLIQWFGSPENVRPLGTPAVLQDDIALPFYLKFRQGQGYFFPLADYDIGEIDLFFERGRICLPNYCEEIVAFKLRDDPYFKGYQRLMRAPEQPAQPDYLRYQLTVLDAIISDFRNPAVNYANGDNALETLKICRKICDEAQDPDSCS